PVGAINPASTTSEVSHRPPSRRAEVRDGRTAPCGPVEPIKESRTGAVLMLIASKREQSDGTTTCNRFRPPLPILRDQPIGRDFSILRRQPSDGHPSGRHESASAGGGNHRSRSIPRRQPSS